jgi:RimJ/RimL family protein N-acetyltransferase
MRRYLWDDVVIPRETAEEVLESYLTTSDSHGIGFWAVHLPPEPIITGFCGFRFFGEGREVELLYGLRSEHWGQGLATEASMAVLDYFWVATPFTRVYARADPPNAKSMGVMKRLGMSLESITPALVTYVLSRPSRAGQGDYLDSSKSRP